MNIKRKIGALLGTLMLFGSTCFADAIAYPYEREPYNYGNDYSNMVVIIGGIVIVLVIAIVVIVLMNKKSKSQEPNSKNEENDGQN